jgi:ribonuclease G
MGKKLLINQTLNEVRIALIDNGEIVDFYVERSRQLRNSPVVGSIYMGKVVRVLPGMQSAFIDIGYERAAFLYVDDAYLPTLSEQREMAQRLQKSHEAEADRHPLGEVIPDEFSTLSETVDMKFRPDVAIQDFLKEGDKVLVQVAKEPISTKGPRVTRHITFAGRYIVFMPLLEHVGVSRRIDDEKERDRLRECLENFRPDGMGVIARTVAEGQSGKTLKVDFSILQKIWREVKAKADKTKPANLVYEDLNFIQRALRDITDESVEMIIVDNKENLKEVDKFILKFLPFLKGKIELHSADTPLFEHFGIEIEVERALGNKVFLKSGGSINIDQTEALVSIDINTGKFVGKKTLEETILQTNLEAVKEIAYQLRLRNCGGIIIIDFIDMEKEDHRNLVYQRLLEELKKDRAKTNVLPISSLGLVEMTRKRTRDTLTRVMNETCPYCEGTGNVKSVLTVCYEIIRELSKNLKKALGSRVTIYAHPEVSARLCSSDLQIIDNLEEEYGKTLIIRSENSFHVEQYEIDI